MGAPGRPLNARVESSVRTQWVMMELLFDHHALTWRLLSFHVSRIGEPLLNRNSPLRELCKTRFIFCILVLKPLFYRIVDATASSSCGSHCSFASLSLLRSEEYLLLVFKRTVQAVQRGPSISLSTACVVHSLSTTVTLGQSLGETKRWVNTSLTSNLRRTCH